MKALLISTLLAGSLVACNQASTAPAPVAAQSVPVTDPAANRRVLDGVRVWWNFLFNKPAGTTPERPLPVQAITPAELLAAPDGSLYRLGHSTVLFKLKGKFWLTDPVFSERASPVQWLGPQRFHAPPISIDELPPIEAVILSHDHYDHLDHASILRLREKTAHFLAPRGVGDFWFYTTQYLQGVLGMRPLQAGLAYLPATLVNFAVALAVPRLTQRLGNAHLLALGLAVTIAGMTWLSLIGSDASYLTGVALPMVLIGAGQGGALSLLTVAGVAGVAPEDAGAASGLVNAAHQLGSSLGLGLLVVVFATAAGHGVTPRAELAHQITATLTASTGMLLAALLLVLLLIVRGASPTRPIPFHQAVEVKP